jgi:hypothetical protein
MVYINYTDQLKETVLLRLKQIKTFGGGDHLDTLDITLADGTRRKFLGTINLPDMGRCSD